jgi:hypothetical protein
MVGGLARNSEPDIEARPPPLSDWRGGNSGFRIFQLDVDIDTDMCHQPTHWVLTPDELLDLLIPCSPPILLRINLSFENFHPC